MALPSIHLLPSSSAWHISSSNENMFFESSVQYTWTVEAKCIEKLKPNSILKGIARNSASSDR